MVLLLIGERQRILRRRTVMINETEIRPAYVILGGAGGIGRAVAARLLAHDFRVLLAGRTPDRLCAAGEALGCPTVQLDATQVDAVEDCFQQAAEMFGRLDGAVNCVGSLLLKPAHLTSLDDWNETLRTNLTTAFATVRAASKTMRRAGGSIVLMSSAAARIGLPSHEAIAAAKAGVIGLALSAAASYAGAGLRFNVVAPGLTKTPLTESIWSRSASATASEEMHPLGRLGEPSDIASAIAWLLDPENGWITGQVIAVDGGLSSIKPALRRRPS